MFGFRPRRLRRLAFLACLFSAGTAFASPALKGIACRSVHLAYAEVPPAAVFYNEVKVESSADGTYFCVCGFSRGYYGIQELYDGRKVLIFSVWDPGQQDDPNSVDPANRVKLLHQDESVRVGRFGNEGTGGQSFLDYDWKVGQTYRFMVAARRVKDRTEYAAFFFHPEEKAWKHLVTFSTLTKDTQLKGYYAFVEDFRRNRVSATKTRRAAFPNAWVMTSDAKWQPVEKARFTADGNPVVNINAGVNERQFYLATGGDITNDDVKLRAVMQRDVKEAKAPADAEQAALAFLQPAKNAQTTKTGREWSLVVHGGAGTPPEDATAEQLQQYRDGLTKALSKGRAVLADGGTSLNAVESVIRILEDDPLYNAGKGAVFNSQGEHELDASIMDGRTLDGGAVAGVRTVKNPIGLARLVMAKTRHVLLSGAGAEEFASEQQVDRVANSSFSTEYRRQVWERVRTRKQTGSAARWSPARAWDYGTVGCVARDSQGNIAAGTSTGGLTNKKFGRVGDSPIIGAGTYADNDTCGISASGIGEQFIRHAAAAQISLLMRHREWSLKQSAEHVLKTQLRPGDGGVIGIDRTGEIVWVFTTPGMFRAAADATGRFEVRIRNE
jgi:isoaspartyl peptidase/L-asparaginase-like protein (Ntn-hydrolase superfamily)